MTKSAEENDESKFDKDRVQIDKYFIMFLPVDKDIVEMPVKCELPAKIGRCSKKPYGHNFHISALKLNQRYFDIYEIPLIQGQG